MTATTSAQRTRVYVVRESARFPNANGAPVRLVRSYGRSNAVAHCARDLYEVTLASQTDMEQLLSQGVKVERAEQPHEVPEVG